MVAEYEEHVTIKFICRYPHRRNGDVMIYKKLSINDDKTLENILNIPSRDPDQQHVEIYVVKEEGSTMNTSVVQFRITLVEEAPGQRMCSLFSQGECIEARGSGGSVDLVERLVALGETGTQVNEDADADAFQSDNSDEDINVLMRNEANDDVDDDGHEDPNIGEALHDTPHIPFFTNLVGTDDVVGGRDLYNRCPTWSDVTSEFAKWMVFKDKDAVIRAFAQVHENIRVKKPWDNCDFRNIGLGQHHTPQTMMFNHTSMNPFHPKSISYVAHIPEILQHGRFIPVLQKPKTQAYLLFCRRNMFPFYLFPRVLKISLCPKEIPHNSLNVIYDFLGESCKVVANLPENRESALLSRNLVGNLPQSRRKLAPISSETRSQQSIAAGSYGCLAGAPIGHGWCDGGSKQSRHGRRRAEIEGRERERETCFILGLSWDFKYLITLQVTSPLTGPIVVDDVVYEIVDNDISRLFPSKDLIFRRLTFQRMEGLVQSEALLTKEGSQKILGNIEQKKTRSSSKSKKKGNQRRNDPKLSVKVVVIGLGAGLLPMFLHACLPILCIEAVELDPVVLNLARDFFGFREDEDLKVHVTDGIQFVKGNYEVADRVCNVDPPYSNGTGNAIDAEGKKTNRIDVLIVDVDSSDSSSGLTCPASDFVEESFLSTVKNSLSEQGLFVINLVSRSSTIREMVVSRMKMVFSNLFHLQLEEDVNEVLFALNTNVDIKEDCFQEASLRLEKLLKFEHPERSKSIIGCHQEDQFSEVTSNRST
ncbi:S-adenosyl-L-methionine-dependent methyltransferases superfamily protein [Actinidia rufa]|uniref:S-adenosyl-L-methionine-dependent methyltransferases superfamily protein n=1 Tax=Actinidia rufa TaxID=165716 RepID=A0A7J0E5S8_9ERIC|nr:S-adenosyl-L-methionine-dependent methyltransferases superfamily protein [Actinidia rufa]